MNYVIINNLFFQGKLVKQLDTASLRTSVTFSIVITMFILILIVVTITNSIQNYTHKQREQEHTVKVYNSVEQTIEHYIKEYKYIAKRIIETTPIIELLKQRDRDGVYQVFKHKWDLMREEEPFLKVIHFHLSDGSSFLRMHKPMIFEDNLIDIRPMIKEIHHSHKLVHGFEAGKYGSLYRVITPIFDSNQTYIGALEFGLNLNFIIRELREINNMQGLIFIKDDKLTFFDNPKNLIIDGFKLLSEPKGELKVISSALTTLNYDEDDVTISTGDKQYNIHVFTLNDFQNQPKIKILIFHDINKLVA